MFAALREPVRQKMEQCDFRAVLADRCFSSVHAAEHAFRAPTSDDRTPGGGG